MKRAWNSPEVEELTIQATSCNDGWYGGGYGGGRPNYGRPNHGHNNHRRPQRPGGGGRPGFGGYGGDDKPGWDCPEDETSSC